jgi:hypothetical protein
VPWGGAWRTPEHAPDRAEGKGGKGTAGRGSSGRIGFGASSRVSDNSGRIGFGSSPRNGGKGKGNGKGKGELPNGKGNRKAWANLPKRPKNDKELRAELDRIPTLERLLGAVAVNESKLGDDDVCHALAVAAKLSKSAGYSPWAPALEEASKAPPGWVALARKVADGAPHLAVRSLTKALHALGSLGAQDHARAALVGEAFMPLLLARLGAVADDAARAFESAGPGGEIPDGMLDPMAVASCLWAVGKVFGTGGGSQSEVAVPPAVLQSLMACFSLMAARGNSQDLGNTVWGLARLRCPLSPSLEAALHARALELLPPAPGAKMKAQELADLLWGLGALSTDSSGHSSQLVAALASECGRRAALSSQGLTSADALTAGHVLRAIGGLSRYSAHRAKCVLKI